MRKRNNTTTNLLQMIVGCSGAGISTNASQIGADPTLTLILESYDGQHYLLPLSEPGVTALQQVLSNWRQTRNFLSEQMPPLPATRQ